MPMIDLVISPSGAPPVLFKSTTKDLFDGEREMLVLKPLIPPPWEITVMLSVVFPMTSFPTPQP